MVEKCSKILIASSAIIRYFVFAYIQNLISDNLSYFGRSFLSAAFLSQEIGQLLILTK